MRLSGRLRAGADPDLHHLPVSLNLRAISVAEGVRAALAIAAVAAVNEWLDIPVLAEAGLGALLTCLCDPGGPIRRRVPALMTFALLGAVATAVFGVLRTAGVVPAAIGGTVWICGAMFARAWGPTAMQVGNLLTVVAVLALDHGEPPGAAATLALVFVAGSLWAVLLSLVIWRLHPFRPARLAVADVYRRIGALTSDVAEQLAAPANPDWAAHARGHRRYVRDGIEAARAELLDVLRSRGQGGIRGNALLIQIEAAEQVFGAVIALSDILEHEDATARASARHVLPALRLLLAGIAEGITADRAGDEAHRTMFIRLLAEIEQAAQSPAIAEVTKSLLERLRIAALMTMPEGETVEGVDRADRPAALQRWLGPLRSNLNWNSAPLRHAIRATAFALPALLMTLPTGLVYAHWLTITLILTLQPYFAMTWQRALERVAGTVLGGLLAAGIAVFAKGPVATAALLFPVAVAAFAVRRVSFGLFMVGLTPLVVLLSELGQQGASEIEIALYRTLFTLAGGAMAVLGGLLLWPSWEPARVKSDLRAAIRAHGAYAEAELAALMGEGQSNSPDAARRAAGMASNNLEATLSRALQEPRGRRRELRGAMLTDAALRRIAGRLAALQHSPGLAGSAEASAWRTWLSGAFAALEQGKPLPGPAPADSETGALARIARQITLIDGALRPAELAPAAEPAHQAAP